MEKNILECKRCGFKWKPRIRKPRKCSRCKNPWNIPYFAGKGGLYWKK